MKRKIRLLLFFLFITSAFLLLNYSITTLWGETYVDMSGNQSHTLSEASKQILNDLKIKQTIRLYISPQIAKDYPQTSQYSRYVADLLKRYAKQSGGKLSFEQIEIEPYSKEEDDAKAYGLKTFLSRDGKINLYFGAVIFNENGEEQVIPNFVELRRPYLENDISEIIYRLSKGSSKNTIGLIAPEWNLYYTANGFLDGNKNLNILNKLSENYNIQVISEYALQIGLNINTLILVNPSHDLPNVSRYALDQFVLRGGNLIILTDPDYPGEKIRNTIAQQIPNCKHAFIDKKRAIKKNKVGVAECDKEEILHALKHALTPTSNPIHPLLTPKDLFDLHLLGPESKLNREKISLYFHLGYCNGKTFLKRLNLLNLTKKEIEVVLNHD